jgi:hypothetical protein
MFWKISSRALSKNSSVPFDHFFLGGWRSGAVYILAGQPVRF